MGVLTVGLIAVAATLGHTDRGETLSSPAREGGDARNELQLFAMHNQAQSSNSWAAPGIVRGHGDDLTVLSAGDPTVAVIEALAPSTPLGEALAAVTPTPILMIPSPGGVGVLTEAEMRALLAQVPWPTESTETILAITFCESGWDPNAIGKAGELGLAQVHPDWHPDATTDPLGNLRAALRISSGGTDWSAWSCNRSSF